MAEITWEPNPFGGWIDMRLGEDRLGAYKKYNSKLDAGWNTIFFLVPIPDEVLPLGTPEDEVRWHMTMKYLLLKETTWT